MRQAKVRLLTWRYRLGEPSGKTGSHPGICRIYRYFSLSQLHGIYNFSSGLFDSGLSGIQLTQVALEGEVGKIGSVFVAVAVFFFAVYEHRIQLLLWRNQSAVYTQLPYIDCNIQAHCRGYGHDRCCHFP